MKRLGFTLIEILVVVAIIGTVAGVVLVQLRSVQAQARDARRMADLRAVEQALEIYNLDNDAYPLSTPEYQIQGGPWGGNWPGHLELVPKDPLSPKQTYIYVSEDGKTYQLYANFEGEIDSVLSCGECGPDGKYNAGIAGGQNSFLLAFNTAPSVQGEGAPAFEVPQGRQVYDITSGGASPKFKQAIVDPVDVQVGDTQKMSVWVIETAAGQYITEVTANVETDTGPRLYNLSLTTGSNIDGWWEGSWVVQDTHSRKYLTTFIAKNNVGETAQVTVTWSDPCAPPAGGNYTLDGNCSITGVNGVDNGNFFVASGYTLTLQPSSTFVWNPGFGIRMQGGKIAKGSGASLKKTYLWMTDADADNYPSSTTQVAQDSAPANGRRRNLMTTTSSTDCLDSSANVYANQTVATDSDQDGYGTSSASSQCAGASTTVSGRTYYMNSAGSYAFIASASTLGTSDCNDASATAWVNRYTDADSDDYCPNSSQSCVGSQAGYTDSCAAFTDCNDGNAGLYQNLTCSGGADGDGDTYSADAPASVCSGASCPSGYSAQQDCNDGNNQQFPGQTACLAPAADYDCSGVVDVCASVPPECGDVCIAWEWQECCTLTEHDGYTTDVCVTTYCCCWQICTATEYQCSGGEPTGWQ